MRDWRIDAALLAAIGLLITLVFADGALDFATARPFYRSDPEQQWPLGNVLPWSVLYGLAPWITASLVLGALAALAYGWLRRHLGWRQHAVFVLLTVVLGPGALINFVFKDNWERPRPRDVVEFGGPLQYAPAPLRGEGGKSFPCGHCSVGFLYGLGWWIWRGRRPAWAAASLAFGLLAGTALGVGRLAAGGHFASDIVWSAFLAYGVAHLLYHYVLRIPEPRARLPLMRAFGRHAPVVLSMGAAVGGLGVLLALFVLPHGEPFGHDTALASLPETPKVFAVAGRRANVEIAILDRGEVVTASGELHGFGLPGSRLETRSEFIAEPLPTLRYVIEQHGWFTDLDASMSVRLPVGELERIVVRLQEGNIRITDTTAGEVLKTGRIRLDVRSGEGTLSVAD